MKKIIFLVVVILYISGCSTMFNERKQVVYVDSDPKGLLVKSSKLNRAATSPTSFTFDKDGQSVSVRVEADGYIPQDTILEKKVTPSFWANFLWGYGFPIGMLVDYSSGAMWNYQDNVYMKLESVPSKP